jgi:hypothetical protein
MMITDHETPHSVFLPVPCNLVPFRPRYLPQHPVLGYENECENPKSNTLWEIQGYLQNCNKVQHWLHALQLAAI